MPAPRTPAFRGRARERQGLDGLLDRVRADALLRAPGLWLPASSDPRRGIRDGAAARGAAPALHADAEQPGRAAGAAAARVAGGVRVDGRTCPGPVRPGPSRSEPAGRERRRTPA